MFQIQLLTFKPAVETIASLAQQLNGLRLPGSYLLLLDHNRRSSQLFFLTFPASFHSLLWSQPQNTISINEITMPEHLPLSCPSWHSCSTVNHFDCSLWLPLYPDIFPYTIYRPSFLPSTKPKLKLHSSSYNLIVVLLAWSFVLQHYLRKSKYHDFYRHHISSCPEGHAHATLCI